MANGSKIDAHATPNAMTATSQDPDLIALKAQMFDDAEAKLKAAEAKAADLGEKLGAAHKHANELEASAKDVAKQIAAAERRAKDAERTAGDATTILENEKRMRHEESVAASTEIERLKSALANAQATAERRLVAPAHHKTGSGVLIAMTNIRAGGAGRFAKGEVIPESVAKDGLTEGIHFERK